MFSLKLSRISRNILLKTKENIKISRFKSYEGDGKTTAKIINEDADVNIMIKGYSQIGFRLNNDMTVLGPMAIFPRSVLSWNIKTIHDINEDSLKLFSLLEPKLDIFVLGTGDYTNDTNFFMNVVKFMRNLKIGIEILPTEQAVSTFNFLNSEGRCVAGGFIPPTTIKTSEDEIVQDRINRQRIYELDD